MMQGLVVYTLSHYGARVIYALGVLPLLPLHCFPYSTRGGFLLSSPMDKQQHKYMRIQITPAVDTAPPPWCQSSTLLLDFPPLDEHVADWQALKLNTPGCQIYDPIHFEAHLIPSFRELSTMSIS